MMNLSVSPMPFGSGRPVSKALKASQGFTLIEVLVALSIFAVAVATMSGAMRNNVSNSNYLRDKTLAHWVASNKMVEIQQSDVYPPIEDRRDKVEFGGRQWIVRTRVEKTVSVMRKLEISVGVEQGGDVNYLSFLEGYFSDAK